MKISWKKTGAAVAAISLCGVMIAGAEGMAYREKPIVTVKVDAMDAISDSLEFNVEQGECFQVELFAAGGTGYEWVLTNKDMKLLKVFNTFTEPVDKAKQLAGGKMRTVYIVEAKPDAYGTEKLNFLLRRAWEEPNLAARKVVCEVNVQ